MDGMHLWGQLDDDKDVVGTNIIQLVGKEWFTADALATRLNISSSTVRRRAKKGHFERKKRGKHFFYRTGVTESEEDTLQEIAGATSTDEKGEFAESVVALLAERLIVAQREQTLAEVTRDEALLIHQTACQKLAQMERERDLALEDRDLVANQLDNLGDAYNSAITDRERALDRITVLLSERDTMRDEIRRSHTRFTTLVVELDRLAEQLHQSGEHTSLLRSELHDSQTELQDSQTELQDSQSRRQALELAVDEVNRVAHSTLAFPIRNRLLTAVCNDYAGYEA